MSRLVYVIELHGESILHYILCFRRQQQRRIEIAFPDKKYVFIFLLAISLVRRQGHFKQW